MKSRLLIISIISIVLIVPSFSYGISMSPSTQTLLEQSETIFVGIIESVNVIDFEKSTQFQIEENGVSKIIIKNYTLSLDNYIVDITEYLKNPQETDTFSVLQPIVSTPGKLRPFSEFEIGDNVLFFIPKIDESNRYFPASFKIPMDCDAQTVLEQPINQLSDDFKMIQNGVELSDNFTANVPIKSIYEIGARTLEGESFDVIIEISKIVEGKRKMVFDYNIHAESKPCEWMMSAIWEFTPTDGKYFMHTQTTEGNQGSRTSSGYFTVIENKFQTKCAPGTVLENGTCGSCVRGFILVDGTCRELLHGKVASISFDEPHHPIPYIQNTSLNQMSNIMLIMIVVIGVCLVSLFYFWRKKENEN